MCRYRVVSGETGEVVVLSLDLRLEEFLVPAYRRIQVEKAWFLHSLLGEESRVRDERLGPEEMVRRRGLRIGDKILNSVQVSAKKNVIFVGRTEAERKSVLLFLSELSDGHWRLKSVDSLTD